MSELGPQSHKPGAVTMTTYRRLDGDLVDDEYRYVLALPDGGDEEDPVEFVQEVWTLTESSFHTVFPPLYDCGLDGCDNDATKWVSTDFGWRARCPEHEDVFA